MIAANDTLLEVTGLRTVFDTRDGSVCAVAGVDVTVRRGECLGVVGESGSGKSVTFSSVMGLVRSPGRIDGGSIRFDGRDLRALTPKQMRAIRGRDIAMTMQDALTALNPALTVGEQIAEMLIAHDETLPAARGARKTAIREKSVEMLGLVGIPSAADRLSQYPHEFSGGMRQRIMIAIALASRPKLLVADEPTTALDVTIQAQVLELITDIRAKLGMSVVLITHDLGVVAEHCDRVMVMYAGQVVEEGPTDRVIRDPKHPYTKGLLGSIPRLSMRGQPIKPIEGQVPDLIGLPPQCRFYSRCPERVEACLQPIAMHDAGENRHARCIKLAGETVA
ncbi:ABC transporter ATP-binding protein [Oricola indica]|uniref:ABC transporter ATP-binding protein n=1 Tax=Oricola indica TaxID=2872591 RepID=UPI003CCBEBB4